MSGVQLVQKHFGLFRERVCTVDVAGREFFARLLDELADLRSCLLLLLIQLASDSIERLFRLFDRGVCLLTQIRRIARAEIPRSWNGR